ncbi:hypothetical protein OIU85_025302 [Salix viminalis]|uniref:CRAL/TRIO N-terminal domain-containing protein n=1 Tax=Salix viminalis TaxID=40686 RepID=A0A9Q0TL84_SALVM|nr:hypothetical protein OIU85_025302 [Salix viminalis]
MEFKSIEESNGMITEEKGNQTEINEIEQNKVRLMRAHVEREDSSVKEVDDLMIRRFLRARELDIEKASTLFLKVPKLEAIEHPEWLHISIRDSK